VFATNAEGFDYGYPQILNVLPLSAFGDLNAAAEVGAYPHVDTKGAIVGIATNSGESYHDVILVNVRPHVTGVQGETTLKLVDIVQDVEIRAYSTSNLQLLYTYTGHRGFTLKDCPFYIFLDAVTRGGRQSSSELHVPHDLNVENYKESSSVDACSGELDGVLIASGSEDHKVYIWMGNHASPVQVMLYIF
jgi:hypothetical protein